MLCVIDLIEIRRVAVERNLSLQTIQQIAENLEEDDEEFSISPPTLHNLFKSEPHLRAFESGEFKKSEKTIIMAVAKILERNPKNILLKDDLEGRTYYDLVAKKDGSFPVEDNKAFANDATEELPSSKVSENTIPIPASSFLGRDDEVAEVIRRFQEKGERIVMVTAPPCVGKTRVAMEAARQLAESTDWLVHWIEMTDATTESGIAFEVVNNFPGAERLTRSQTDQLQGNIGQFLKERGDTLLVVDNFEQVAQFAESTLAVWLANAPKLRILVTSRIMLNIAGMGGGKPIVLKPLDHADLEQCQNWPVERILQKPACELFRQRSEVALYGDFEIEELDEEELRTVGRIVARCDGFPAPIELAAAQVPPTYSLEELEGVLSREVFASGDFDKERRALHNAIDGILESQFSENEQRAFFQLSNFVGGFTKSAFDAVIGDGSEELSRLWSKLIGYNLIRPIKSTRRRKEKLMGFYLPVQEYAENRWEKAANVALASDHEKKYRAYYIAEAKRLDKLVRSKDRPQILRQIDDIRENVLKVIRNDLKRGEPAAALESLLSISESLRIKGPAEVYLELIKKLYAFDDSLEPVELAALIREHAIAFWNLGQFDKASEKIAEALEKVSELGDHAIRAKCLETMSQLPRSEYGPGHHSKQLEREFEARDIFLRLRDKRGELLNGGFHLDWLGRPDESIKAYEKTVEHARDMGDPYVVARYLSALGLVLWRDGSPDKAVGHFSEAKDMFEQIEDRNFVGGCLTNTAFSMTDMGQTESEKESFLSQAETAFDEGREIFEELNNRAWLSTNLVGQMRLALRKGDFRGALDFGEEHRSKIYGSQFDDNRTLFSVVEGAALAGLEDYGKALASLTPAIEHLTSIEATITLRCFSAQVLAALCYSKLEDTSKAISAVEAAKEIAERKRIGEEYGVVYIRERWLQLEGLADSLGAKID